VTPDKNRKFRITQNKELYEEYIVEAESEDEAIDKFDEGEWEKDDDATTVKHSEIVSVGVEPDTPVVVTKRQYTVTVERTEPRYHDFEIVAGSYEEACVKAYKAAVDFDFLDDTDGEASYSITDV
jgi:hypothetical protein